ncbi:MAG: putative quinol monooxygenase [Henriciella sp.]|jgi:quinol monooxygenase YgiN
MSETVHIFATIKLKPEHFEKARSAVAEIVPMTLNELGCRAFALYTSQSDANTLHLFEMFESEDALAHHYAQDYTKRVFQAYEEWLAEPVLVQRITPYSATSNAGAT